MNFKSLVLVSALALAPMAAFAGGSGGGSSAGAVAGASAGANSGVVNDLGNAIGGASVGAAYCTDGVAVGPVAVSKTIRACVAAQIAETGGRMGSLHVSEVRAIQLEALDRLGFGLRAGDSTTVSKKDWSGAANAAPAKAGMMTYNGDWKSLSRKAQRSILSCETLWNGKEIQSCAGKY
jgi:hypothetical protein